MEIDHKTLKASVVRWPIDDFFVHVNGQTESLRTDENFALDGLNTKFYLRVWLYDGDSNRLSYCLVVADMAGEKPIEIEFKFWLENDKGKKCAETPVTTKTFEDDEDWDGFRNVLNHDELHSNAAFFGNGPVVVCCEITRQVVVDGPESFTVDKAMRESFWKSYENGPFDGVTIQVEEKEFKVSKTVLAANSAVFDRMLLTPNCKEVQSGIIQIKDTNVAAMEAFIEYVNYGEVDISETIAIDLFKLSHKYDVESLNALCTDAIGKSVSSEKLFEILILAYEYDCEQLKNAVSFFLLANREQGYFTSLTKTREWQDFAVENRQLANDILTGIYDQMGIKSIMEISHKNQKVLKTTYEKISVVRWTIDDFFGHVNKKTHCLYSKKFELDGLDAKFYLQVWLYGINSNRLSYYLRVADMADKKPIFVKFKFWLENDKGEKYAETPAKTDDLHDLNTLYGFPEVLNHFELHSKAAFFGNGPAVVFCEITYQADGPEPSKIDKKLREDLWKSYQAGLFDGFTIQVEEKQFKVSKTILAANSAVFKSMFLTPNCNEMQTGIVVLKDTKAVVVEKLIEYMHRGEVDILESVAIDLFKLSHKYDIKPFNILCAEAIGKSLSEEKLFEIVVMAYEYNLEKLKDAVSSFLLANCEKGYFINLIISKKWKEFAIENDELTNNILIGVYGKMGVKF